jgi:hypothetical protein
VGRPVGIRGIVAMGIVYVSTEVPIVITTGQMGARRIRRMIYTTVGTAIRTVRSLAMSVRVLASTAPALSPPVNQVIEIAMMM